MTVSLNMLVNTLGLLYLVAVLRISILVLASIVVSIFEHSISFVGAFIVILLLLFFCLLGNAGIHILLIVYDCCNFHCLFQLTRWFFRVRPFFFFFVTHVITNLQEYILESHLLFILMFYKLALLESLNYVLRLVKNTVTFKTLLTQIEIRLN